MRILPLAALLLASLSFSGALAQDIAFTSDDELALTSCIEADRAAGAATFMPGLQCIGAASTPCQSEEGGSSTVGITTCNQRENSWWDGWLNDNYKALSQSLEPESAEALKRTQRAWIAWRDAKCEFIYQYWINGTIRSNFASYCQMETTAQRALELAALVDGPEAD